jgi:hypothetical protein
MNDEKREIEYLRMSTKEICKIISYSDLVIRLANAMKMIYKNDCEKYIEVENTSNSSQYRVTEASIMVFLATIISFPFIFIYNFYIGNYDILLIINQTVIFSFIIAIVVSLFVHQMILFFIFSIMVELVLLYHFYITLDSFLFLYPYVTVSLIIIYCIIMAYNSRGSRIT